MLASPDVDEDEYGALVKWYWQGDIKVLGEKKSQCHVVHHKTHMDLPGVETGSPGWGAGD
jgi:hypothetical protein